MNLDGKSIEPLEAYYSSDDDVSWGPVTLREIKRDFRNPPLRPPTKRVTDSFVQYNSKVTESMNHKNCNDNMSSTSIKSSTSGESEYNTANNTITSNKLIPKIKIEPCSPLKSERDLNESATNPEIIIIDSSNDSFADSTENESDVSGVIEINESTDFDNNSITESPKNVSKENQYDSMLSDSFEDKSGSNNLIQSTSQTADTESNYLSFAHNSLAIGAEYSIHESSFSDKETSIIKDLKADETNNSVLNDTLDDIDELFRSHLELTQNDSNINESISSQKSNVSNIPIPKKPAGSFKVPLERPKSAKKLPSTSHLKDIVSPVRLYIKNSPVSGLKRNIVAPELPKAPFKNITSKISNQANIPESLPFVRYKPSGNTIENCQNLFKIPANIRKLIVEPTIIKHESRTNVSFGGELADSDTSLVQQDDRNVSVHTNKYGFRY